MKKNRIQPVPRTPKPINPPPKRKAPPPPKKKVFETKTVGILRNFLKGLDSDMPLLVFNPKSRVLEEVISFHINGQCIQFNVEGI